MPLFKFSESDYGITQQARCGVAAILSLGRRGAEETGPQFFVKRL
jgi:hypothetical protein